MALSNPTLVAIEGATPIGFVTRRVRVFGKGLARQSRDEALVTLSETTHGEGQRDGHHFSIARALAEARSPAELAHFEGVSAVFEASRSDVHQGVAAVDERRHQATDHETLHVA